MSSNNGLEGILMALWQSQSDQVIIFYLKVRILILDVSSNLECGKT